MSSRRAALVLAFVALSGGALGACGGGDALVDSVPKSTPDLTVPDNGAGLPPAQTTATSGTTTTDTTATTTTGAGSTAAPTTQSTSTPQTGGTGGTPSGGTATPTTSTPSSNSGGTPAGGFSDFCKQNPGACGQ